jgi:hypothetical protein
VGARYAAENTPDGRQAGDAWWWRRKRIGRQRSTRRRAGRPKHWNWGAATSAVTALGTIAALVFTGLSLRQTYAQFTLNESGQITDRYTTAVADLGSSNETLRIGGIYALQRLMKDSPQDQPAIVQVLSAYVREAAPLPTTTAPSNESAMSAPQIDVQTVLNILGSRNPAYDAGTQINLSGTDLVGAVLTGDSFAGADFSGTDLSHAELMNTNLNGANLGVFSPGPTNIGPFHFNQATNLSYANLTDAKLANAGITFAVLDNATLTGTPYCKDPNMESRLHYNCDV